MTEIVKYNKVDWKKRLMISTPTEGWIRFEWAHARYGQVIPVNWSASGFDINYTVAGYSIDDAYNIIAKKVIELDVQWLIIIEDDVLVPPDTFLKFAKYMDENTIPIVSGLYFTKGNPSEPLLFRGRGNGVYHDWDLGDKVWVDGLPMGCLLLNCSILRYLWNESGEYALPDGERTRKVFETPKFVEYDILTNFFGKKEGTQDLNFFDRIIENKVLEKTGWEMKEYPFLCDTTIFCKHIDRKSGMIYPS